MRCNCFQSIIATWILAAVAYAAESPVSFRNEIAPILESNCLACHGTKKAEGGYRVDSYDELLKPGDSGEIPIADNPMDPSELIRRITCEDEFERMPVDSDPLTAEQIALFTRWVVEGAKFDGDDSSQPLALVIPPPAYGSPPEHYPHAMPITALTFSPDGHMLISSGYHEVLVWDINDGSLQRRIPNIGQRVFALSFSSDGETLAIGCGEPGRSGEVRLIDFAKGEVSAVISRTSDVVVDLEFCPGKAELAVASADGLIRIIDTDTSKEIRTVASHADWVTSVTWSDDGTLLASSSRDKSAKVFDAASGDLVSSYLGHKDSVRDVSILPGNNQVVSVGADKKLHRWNIADNKKVAEVALGSDGHAIVRYGEQLLIPCADGRLSQIDLTKNQIARQYKGHTDWVLSVARQPGTVDPANQVLASGSFNGEVKLWNAAKGTVIRGWIAKP